MSAQIHKWNTTGMYCYKDHLKCRFPVEMLFCEFEVIILVITEGYNRLFNFCLVCRIAYNFFKAAGIW